MPGLSDEKLRELKRKAVLHFYLAMLKSLHSPELKVILPGLVEALVNALGCETAMDYVCLFFRYMAQASPNLDGETMRNALNVFPEGGEEIMNTLAEQWRSEGIEIGEKIGERRGEKKGRLEYARKILFAVASEKLGILPQRIAEEINRIESTEILDELIRKTLRCESVDQFKGWIDKALGGEEGERGREG